jgi:hypothetical protein
MKEELELSDSQISLGVSLFYAGHTIIVLPASMLLLYTTANLQLGLALISWGGFTTVWVLESPPNVHLAEAYVACVSLRIMEPSLLSEFLSVSSKVSSRPVRFT